MDAMSYQQVQPNASYAPWQDDPRFSYTFQQVAENTLVDHFRQYELWQLVAQAVRLPGDILEVGVWRGGTGCLMAKRAAMLKSSARVFLCDTFTGVVKAGERDDSYAGGEHADTSLQTVRELADMMGLDNIELLQGVFPDETGDRIANRSFSLCHIDVDVYESALDIWEWVWPRMPVGGVVVFDDYGFESCTGVTRLVNERFGRDGSVTLHNLNGHAVVVKTGGDEQAARAGGSRWARLLGGR